MCIHNAYKSLVGTGARSSDTLACRHCKDGKEQKYVHCPALERTYQFTDGLSPQGWWSVSLRRLGWIAAVGMQGSIRGGKRDYIMERPLDNKPIVMLACMPGGLAEATDDGGGGREVSGVGKVPEGHGRHLTCEEVRGRETA